MYDSVNYDYDYDYVRECVQRVVVWIARLSHLNARSDDWDERPCLEF